MSLFDWVDLGLDAGGVKGLDKVWKGSYEVTIGDAVEGWYGSYNGHYFGPYLNLVCDVEDMTLGQLGSVLPVLYPLLAGMGGQGTFVYGSNTQATYVGPLVDIRRGDHIIKVSSKIFGVTSAEDEEDPDALDKVTAVAVIALSTLLCLTSAAFDMAMRFGYIKSGSGAGDTTGYSKSGKLIAELGVTVPSRLMALLKALETAGSFADFAEQLGKDVSVVLACIFGVVMLPVALVVSALVVTIALLYVAGVLVWVAGVLLKRKIEEAIEAAQNALSNT